MRKNSGGGAISWRLRKLMITGTRGPSEHRMPFGKYAGTLLIHLPTRYVKWLMAQPWVREPLRSALRREWLVRPLRQMEVQMLEDWWRRG
jgi:hypothetical protein